MTVQPIFILSAPRSGSTLLQRALAAHSQIATASEPWILLPLLSPLYDDLPASGSRDALIHEAVDDFIAQLPERGADYRAAIRECALRLYEAVAGPGVTYFVDKTPLYFLVVDELISTFPDGRFLFLFRNPLSVVASCVELFDQGRWEVSRYHMALFQSFVDLVPASQRYSGQSLTIRYEHLVSGDELRWRQIFDYLDLAWEPEILAGFSTVELRGRKGDPTGTRSYTALSREPLDKWQSTVRNPVRRAWCARYLHWLGRDRLSVMGYELDALQRELSAAGAGSAGLWQDTGDMAASIVREVVKARLPRQASRASTWRALLSA
jgi:hypothetical protein